MGTCVSERWAIVLATGERTEEATLVWTVQRALHLVPEDHVLVVVRRDDSARAREALSAHPRVRLVEEPANRGTLPSLALPLVHITRACPGALVLVLPSDHREEDDAAFQGAVEWAADRVLAEPGAVALLGAPAEGQDRGFGWMVPAGGCEGSWAAVAAFHDRPSRIEISRLERSGACINTLVLAARASRLMRLVEAARPDWARALRVGARNPDALQRAYNRLSPASFTRDVLTPAVSALRLAPLGGLALEEPAEPPSASPCAITRTPSPQPWGDLDLTAPQRTC